MATETERKFLVDLKMFDELYPLVDSDFHEYRLNLQKVSIDQYFIYASKEISVRMRKQGVNYFSTIKYNPQGISVTEITLKISSDEYYGNSKSKVGRVISKDRYLVPHYGKVWEVDFFKGELEGLVVAELEHADAASVPSTQMPIWATSEVTHNPAFKNAVLATSDEWKNAIAPSRKVFYVDVGSMPKEQVEQYIKNSMSSSRILILESKDDYQVLSLDQRLDADFIAYKMGQHYVIAKNRFDGMLGLVRMSEIEKYLQKPYKA